LESLDNTGIQGLPESRDFRILAIHPEEIKSKKLGKPYHT
jgi:hypothetical protein